MSTIRMLPPGNRPSTTTTINGRTYIQALGSILDVPDFDAMNGLRSNGWLVVGMVGTTAQRPVGGLPAGITNYIDTTISKPIYWDGVTWRDYTGASV